MFIQHQDFSPDLLALIGAAEQSIRRVAPLFPLDRAVAVNPFHGMIDEPIATAAARLERAVGIRIFPERALCRSRIASGELVRADIITALAEVAPESGLTDGDILAAADREVTPTHALATVAELAAGASGTDWPGLVSERIGAWAQGYFDEGQALWSSPARDGVWVSWRDWAMHDLTPEIHGLTGFAASVAGTQQNHWRALGDACVALGIDHAAAPSVFHRLLCDLCGWAGLGRYRLWQAELEDSRDSTLSELLTIRLIWEQALHATYARAVSANWDKTIEAHRQPVVPTREHQIDATLLRAVEHASARRLDARLRNKETQHVAEVRPEAQLVFCIDVRSERMRRAIESLSPTIQTVGAAGFFGLPLAHRASASAITETRGPAILAPSLASTDHQPEAEDRRIIGRLGRAVARFSRAAVASFAFVEAAGPLRLGPLLDASLTRGRQVTPHGPAPRLTLAPDSDTALDAAEDALRGMGLTRAFAPLVVFVGHEARVTNDAQARLLQCGACGGHDGAANARVLARLLNETPIRRGLAARGISIPADTVFMAGLHDTTGDTVTHFVCDPVGDRYAQPVTSLTRVLDQAGELVRTERSLRFPDVSVQEELCERGGDWSQTRAEWGLANCSWFIAAPRGATRNLNLDGRAFLHDYDPARDPDGSWLTDILSGPVLVAAWINLQYYGARVAPDAFGGGNKLLQNVVGGFGVTDGISGQLRGGPSDQSLSDGRRFVHEPLRLQVRIATSRSMMERALSKSPIVRTMASNNWIGLATMDET
ncbi:hypothetical protein OCH239_18795 [Roseivivax halodurans JCM 10272]|uniref:Probable inorganic carbon transporter subunit DabA n=1 Tax=Roseivivax halodurans JCM 10272 TaxID=1449350 RepID=X7E829_9RHOB|nr:DUF2309 domain-containing protein [Roseivivax halodurans]ETX11985.1 hypothetical protein OCH239_18795 [Roseivivax halodurans JCM 10272]